MTKEALLTQLGFTYQTAQANLEGIDQEASLVVPGAGGNGINWVLGHIVNTRSAMLDLFGEPRSLDERGAAIYGRGAKTIGAGDDCLSIEELRERLDATQQTLLAKLGGADDAFFAREVPDLFDPNAKTSCAAKLAALLFHEAYHMGQIGTIRHAIGHEPMIK